MSPKTYIDGKVSDASVSGGQMLTPAGRAAAVQVTDHATQTAVETARRLAAILSWLSVEHHLQGDGSVSTPLPVGETVSMATFETTATAAGFLLADVRTVVAALSPTGRFTVVPSTSITRRF